MDHSLEADVLVDSDVPAHPVALVVIWRVAGPRGGGRAVALGVYFFVVFLSFVGVDRAEYAVPDLWGQTRLVLHRVRQRGKWEGNRGEEAYWDVPLVCPRVACSAPPSPRKAPRWESP